MKRALCRMAGALALLALAATAAVLAIGLGSLPRTSGDYRLAGLDGPVAIERDQFGVPHIKAASERDAYRALGFAQAQDRLWQMEFQRRVGQGRLAEVVGAAALPADRYLRTLGLYRAAEASLAGLDPRARLLLDAYVQGVNDWIDGRDRLLPPEFWIFWHAPEPWTAADSAVWIKMMALSLDGDMNGELARMRLAGRLPPDRMEDLWPGIALPQRAALALPDGPAQALQALLPAPPGPGTGSNAFAVAAGRSRSGGALLAGDPHLELRSPGVWYLAHLEAPGLSVTGATMPGLPFVVIGRNATLAWSLTTTGADVQDLFVETVDPADPGRYLAPDGPLAFQLRDETIRIAGGGTEKLTVRATRHGPVVSDLLDAAPAPDRVLSLAWTALDPDDRTIEAGFRLAHAADLDALQDVLAAYRNPVQNFIAADAAGRVGLVVAGAVPVRRSGDGSMPADGASGRADWIGRVPPQELPVILDPPGGTVANANEPVAGDGPPHLISATGEPPWRRQRIDALLAEKPVLDGNDLIRIQRDHRSGFAVDILPTLLGASGLPPDLVELRDSLRGWDGTMAPRSWQAGLFLAWAEHLSRLVREDEPGAAALPGLRGDFLARVLRERPAWCDDRRTSEVEDCATMAGRALERAHAALRAAFGPARASWELRRVQEAALPHAALGGVPVLGGLFGARAAKAGDPYSVDVAGASVDAGLVRRTVTHAASLRIVADLADRARIDIVTAGGQSGHPWSRWFADGVRRWEADRRIGLPAGSRSDRLLLAP
jgi:penicillin amidase